MADVYQASIPSQLGWNSSLFNLGNIYVYNYKTTPFGVIDATVESLFTSRSNALTNPTTVYYVSMASGNDGNNGLSIGQSVKSIYQAITLANATGNPALIYVESGIYPRVNSFSGPSALKPTVDIAVVATGGRVICGPFDQFSAPSRDGTYTNCYSFVLSNALRVLDMANTNALGNYSEFSNVATPALCNATPNSWVISAGSIYINRADQQPVTQLNTRIIRDARNIIVNAAVSVYLGGASGNDGFDFIGGNNNGALDFDITSAGSTMRVFAAKNCTFNYGGGPTATGGNGVSIDSMYGLAVFRNCQSDANWKDGFNMHNVRTSAGVYALTINCSSNDNGRSGNVSCNGYTLHEDCIGIDIGGNYKFNRGGSAHSIGTSKTYFVGTTIDTDLGDIALGGSIYPEAFRTSENSIYWIDTCTVLGPKNMYAMYAKDTSSIIYYRNLNAGSLMSGGAGVIASY